MRSVFSSKLILRANFKCARTVFLSDRGGDGDFPLGLGTDVTGLANITVGGGAGHGGYGGGSDHDTFHSGRFLI